jgi:hypothetical protein
MQRSALCRLKLTVLVLVIVCSEFFWSYSIRMRLLRDSPERPSGGHIYRDDDDDDMYYFVIKLRTTRCDTTGLQSCQLTSRHWRVSKYSTLQQFIANEEEIDEVIPDIIRVSFIVAFLEDVLY